MNELLTQDNELLLSLSQKLISQNISETEQENLIELLGRYQNKDIQETLKEFLTNKDIDVIRNFHDNIAAFSKLITDYELEGQQDNKVLRSYFFTGKKVNDGLLSPAYRHVLNFVQNEATLKVKTELFFDIHSYFKYGCYEEDLVKDEELKTLHEKVTSVKRNKKKGVDLLALSNVDDNFIKTKEGDQALTAFATKIKELNLSRNIGVKVITNKNNNFLSIDINPDYLNKTGIAKSGYIDRVKQTPRGIVVSLGTSDSSFEFQSEREQLANHISALEVALIRKEFKDYSVKDIHAIDFYGLTQYTKKHGEELQEKMVRLGIESELMSFVSKSLGYVLVSAQISEEMKQKISFQGILCADLKNKDIAHLEGTLNSLLDRIIENKDHIVEQVKTDEGLTYVSKYFSNIASFIENSSYKFEIKDHETLIGKINVLVSISKEMGISPIELKNSTFNLLPAHQKLRYEAFVEDRAEAYKQFIDRQIAIKKDLDRQRTELTAIVKQRYDIDENLIEKKAKYNFITARPHSVSKKDREQLGIELKGTTQFNKDPYAFTTFSPAERLYVHLNRSMEDRLSFAYGYDPVRWKQVNPTGTVAKEIISLVPEVQSLDNTNATALFVIGKVWNEEEMFKEKKKTKQLKR